jgi:uncharacterized protein (TIGR03435 family)
MRLAVAILLIAGAAGLALQAQSPTTSIKPSGQAPAATPGFDVAAIHLCPPAVRGGGGRGGPPPGPTGAGRLSEGCKTVSALIREAYQTKGDSSLHIFATTPIEGGPAWTNSDRYSIQARAEGAPSVETMRGRMLQALLEERFQLKIHQETRQASVYALTVAKGGPKLQPTPEGSCVPAATARLTPGLQPCGMPKPGVTGDDLIGETMADFCRLLSLPDSSDRPVIDRTGITGMFDLSIPDPSELSAMRRVHPEDPIPDPLDKLRTLAQRFGLNLVSTRAPAEFLIIDRVERPSEN